MAEQPVKGKKRYLAYLLRLWQENAGVASGGDAPGRGKPAGAPPLWRASLEKPRNGERLGFASLVDLYAFLDKETGSDSPGTEQSDDETRQRPTTPE
jgi:hypothetical protein